MTLRALVYTDEDVTEYDDLAAAKLANGTTWVRADDPDEATLETLHEVFDIHPLAVEDVGNDVRPKVEEFPAHLFVLAKAARLRHGDTTFEKEIDDRPVGLFIGTDWLVTLTFHSLDVLDAVQESVLREDPRVLGRGPDFTAYRVLDRIVDNYFQQLDQIEDRLEYVEEEVLETPEREILEEINDARRELLAMRKLLWPTRDSISTLARGDSPQIQESTEKYYRDVYDHLVQQVDLVETYRELAIGARDIYMNSLSMSTNEVMKRLTIVATIVLPLTLIVGVFGMNFETMPELTWPTAYPAALLGMAGISGVLVYYFRKVGWL
ncbi:magnesium/cobalt transporter CorA [Halocalculus aciditolerans]|uniref:Magnesium transport protein CorA n=1 Tax=Halocalculus aciditolerans TaxID=1383812 RepID=A0A830FAV1_9EURY|nr:magnesium/cobalt transporter CorA [Halocalculus aciditolerans]GGL56736.1 magnesium and cobalt transport protein CorA [Halocalculus aciditolerans]